MNRSIYIFTYETLSDGLFDTIVAELEIVIHDYKKCFNEC